MNQVFAVAQPVSDLNQWSEIFNQISNTFERSSKKPYNVDPASELGARMANLARMDAVRIQVAFTPTTRRLPTAVLLEMTHRVSILQFTDGTRSLELDHLPDLQYPRQRFDKAVQFAVFMYGVMREVPNSQPEQPTEDPLIPLRDLPTDVTFPGLQPHHQVNLDTKRLVARLHLNLGHPSPQEMSRMIAYYGGAPPAVNMCIQHLRCATCERLKPPQHPRPAASPSLKVGQFGDEVQCDFIFLRTINGQSIPVLGLIDRATGFHQAVTCSTKDSNEVFQKMIQVWMKPYGLPYRIAMDPDPSFRGECQRQLEALGIIVDYCPAEAHWMIGAIERRNAILRVIMEKLIDQWAAQTEDDVEYLLTPALHALNSSTFTRGRTAYQAVFGRIPRLPGGIITDDNAITSSPSTLNEPENLLAKIELVRSEAQKHLIDLNVSQQLRRALLRKTNITRYPELQPGQPCAYWRWQRKGPKKKGSWVISRFLSWDPSSPQRLAWVRSGNSSVLVSAEQLRAATGYETWTPSEDDIKALKDAQQSFKDHLLKDVEDESGPPAPEHATEDDLQYQLEPPPALMAIPPTPARNLSASPATPVLPPLQNTTTTTVQLNLDSPTFQQTHQHQTNIYTSYGKAPRTTSRTPRGRSRTPVLDDRARSSRQLTDKQQHTEHLAITEQANAMDPQALDQTQHPDPSQADHQISPQVSQSAEQLPTQAQEQPGEQTQHEQHAPAVHFEEHGITIGETSPEQEQHGMIEQEHLPQLPQKRPHDAMQASLIYADGLIFRTPQGNDGSPNIGYGPGQRGHFVAYTQSKQRVEDTIQIGKQADESDTTQDSDSDNETQATNSTHKNIPPHQRLTRQEAKQLDREIPWREIIQLPPAKLQKYLAAIEKEAISWLEWNSIRPMSEEESKKVLSDPVLNKRILRSRGAYRDKNRGQGELKAKCRVVALGHRDPDIFRLERTSPTPNRTTEHALFCFAVAGFNKEVGETAHSWKTWLADASTAFLQGTQQDANRPLPLYMYPPSDGLIQRTPFWSSPLYEVTGNIYGLPNAPYLWCQHVIKILTNLDYERHSWDSMLFLKYNKQDQIVSMILVYVDDFLGVHRQDYDINEVHKAFTWGELSYFELGQSKTFKGKELQFTKNKANRVILRITMSKFLDTVEPCKISRGRLQQPPLLSDKEKKEYRSISGCLQWLASQARPELCPAVSLSNHGLETTIHDLKALQDALDFAKATPNDGITIQDIPMNKETMIVTYSDASWSNAAGSTSQLGILVVLTTPEAKKCQQHASIMDWRSCRSQRVCRSTLAAEASAADEGSDRAAYVNMLLSQILFREPAHRIGCKLPYVQVTDAKSLYDCIVSPNPTTTDKRSLVNIRAIQETISPSQAHWVPTYLMFADGLTKISAVLRKTLNEWLQSPYVKLAEGSKQK